MRQLIKYLNIDKIVAIFKVLLNFETHSNIYCVYIQGVREFLKE